MPVLFPGALPRAGTLCAFGAFAAPGLLDTTEPTWMLAHTLGGVRIKRGPQFKSLKNYRSTFTVRSAKRALATGIVLRAESENPEGAQLRELSCAPKAQNVSARGNAPGKQEATQTSPERA